MDLALSSPTACLLQGGFDATRNQFRSRVLRRLQSVGGRGARAVREKLGWWGWGGGGWGHGGWGGGSWARGRSGFWRSRRPYRRGYRRWPWLYGGGSGFGFGDSMQDGQSVAWAQGCLSQ